MTGLFGKNAEFNGDVFRNIVSLRESRNLFADLSDGDEAMSSIAVAAEMRVKEGLPIGMIHRGFHYTTAIGYPFETDPYLATRYADGSYGAWYGSLEIDTGIAETVHHMVRELSMVEGIHEVVSRERLVYLVRCRSILIDLRGKDADFPELVADDYSFTQMIGKRLKSEGHPGLLAPSARRTDGANLVAFTPDILSNPRQHCYLTYKYDPIQRNFSVERQPGDVIYTARL